MTLAISEMQALFHSLRTEIWYKPFPFRKEKTLNETEDYCCVSLFFLISFISFLFLSSNIYEPYLWSTSPELGTRSMEIKKTRSPSLGSLQYNQQEKSQTHIILTQLYRPETGRPGEASGSRGLQIALPGEQGDLSRGDGMGLVEKWIRDHHIQRTGSTFWGEEPQEQRQNVNETSLAGWVLAVGEQVL